MIKIDIKTVNLNKSPSDNFVNIEILASIIEDTGKNIKFKIYDNLGHILDEKTEWTLTPIEINKFIYFNDIKYFNDYIYDIFIEVTDEDNNTVTKKYTCNTFIIKDLKRTDKINFEWSVKNLSLNNIQTNLEILDSNNNVVESSNKYIKQYGSSFNIFRIISNSINTLEDGYYFYRIKCELIKSANTIYYPDISGIKFLVRKNSVPKTRIKEAKIRKEKNFFHLEAKIFYQDDDNDNITFKITDNFNNLLYERDRFKYSPKIKELQYNYPLLNFNSSHLILTSTVMDIISDNSSNSYVIPLYSIIELYRERKTFKWKFRNYSNKLIYMQVEILDNDNNFIFKGNILSNRDSYDYIDIEDPNIYNFQRDYYKYRLKVWSDEENWIVYYPFNNGIHFTERIHEAPKAEIIRSTLNRDLDNNKYLNFQANITDKENDSFIYTLTDETGFVIRKARDFIDSPYLLSFNTLYNNIKNIAVNLNLNIQDIHNGISNVSTILKSYNVLNLELFASNYFKWTIENFSSNILNTYIEIFTLDNENNETIIKKSNNFSFSESGLHPLSVKDKLIPKLDEGWYYYRLVIENEEKNYKDYFPNKEGIKFFSPKNNPPIIDIISLDLERLDDNNFETTVEVNITDSDLDYITYQIKDQLNNIYIKENNLQETPKNIIGSFKYNLKDLNISKLFIYIEAIDDSNYSTSITENINLYEIKSSSLLNNKISWLFRNFSNKTLNMQIEILDSTGDLYGASSIHKSGSQISFEELFEYIDFSCYDDGDYFYRIKIWSDDELWTDYYPNINGIKFTYKENNPPIIDVNSIDINKQEENNYDLILNAKITDPDNDKIKYTIEL